MLNVSGQSELQKRGNEKRWPTLPCCLVLRGLNYILGGND